MHAVVARDQLSPNVTRLVVSAPRIAEIRRPGQFVIVRRGPGAERIPLTIADGDAAAGTISLVIQEIGKSTADLVELQVGEAISDIAGPLGRPTDLLEDWARDGSYPVTYVPTISRPSDPRNEGWTGRTGRVEAVVASVCEELRLRPDRTVVYICGNPEMILHAEAVLMHRGFPEFHVKKELYWPKGKDAALLGARAANASADPEGAR